MEPLASELLVEPQCICVLTGGGVVLLKMQWYYDSFNFQLSLTIQYKPKSETTMLSPEKHLIQHVLVLGWLQKS